MISAVAQRYNIHPQTLRLYEREGLLRPSRTDGNTRLYSDEDLERLETILTLTRELGVNLAGVEIILNLRERMAQMQHEVNEFMGYVKQEMVRGLGDWEQRLSTAMVKSAPGSLGRTNADAPAAGRSRGLIGPSLAVRLSSRVLRAIMPIPWTWTANSATERVGRRSSTTANVVSPAVIAGARPRRRGVAPTRAFPAAISTAISRRFLTYGNESLERALASARDARAALSRCPIAACSCSGLRASARRTSRWPILRTLVQEKGARGMFYDTRDLLRVIRSTYDPAGARDRARRAASGDDRRRARARRSRRREGVRVGRRDAEPDRQHALQREAADAVHVQLRRRPRGRRRPIRCCSASASGCGRACTRCASSSTSTAATIASCLPTAAKRISSRSGASARSRAASPSLPAKASAPLRAKLRDGERPAAAPRRS